MAYKPTFKPIMDTSNVGIVGKWLGTCGIPAEKDDHQMELDGQSIMVEIDSVKEEEVETSASKIWARFDFEANLIDFWKPNLENPEFNPNSNSNPTVEGDVDAFQDSVFLSKLVKLLIKMINGKVIDSDENQKYLMLKELGRRVLNDPVLRFAFLTIQKQEEQIEQLTNVISIVRVKTGCNRASNRGEEIVCLCCCFWKATSREEEAKETFS